MLGLLLICTSLLAVPKEQVLYFYYIILLIIILLSGIDSYDQKLTLDWEVVVQQNHQRIEENFREIQAVMNLLIGLTTITIGLLMSLVMG